MMTIRSTCSGCPTEKFIVSRACFSTPLRSAVEWRAEARPTNWFPIRVKQMDKVGGPDTDAFQAVMEREGKGGRSRVLFVAVGYSRDAEQECVAFHR